MALFWEQQYFGLGGGYKKRRGCSYYSLLCQRDIKVPNFQIPLAKDFLKKFQHLKKL